MSILVRTAFISDRFTKDMTSKQKDSQKSDIVDVVKRYIELSEYISILKYIKKWCKKDNQLITEVYVLFFVNVITYGLILMKYSIVISWVIFVFSVYRLIDIFIKFGKVIFIDSNLILKFKKEPYIFLPTLKPYRWVILQIVNIYEIVLCYAVLYLHFGYLFSYKIENSLTAIYYSILTFTTLGYGDIKPTDIFLKTIVITQLIFFIVIIFLIIPAIFSLLRTEKKSK